MSNDLILQKTREFVHEKLAGEGSGHDWWHIVRVTNMAHTIRKSEGGDAFVIELGALLHDIADWKFHDGDTTVGPKVAGEWLQSLHVDPKVIEKVAEIVAHISYRGGTNQHKMQTIEAKIVQDADRLDGLGAIGIARTFAFGGHAGREMYNPAKPPKTYANFQSFKASITENTTINHFYEKLLLLKDSLNTPTARALAAHRHAYIETFLQEFYDEWEGKK